MVSTSVDGEDSSPNPADVVYGSTFDGLSYKIALERCPFECGSSAKIRRGQIQNVNETTIVAVKVFGGMLDRVKTELLFRELRFSRKVSMGHPGILRFLGTATVGEQTAIVSLYMGNGNMMDYLKTHPGCDKKRLIIQVAEAVEYLHDSARLVHGDIKCSNVLISDIGDALLSDFGLSTFAEKSQLATITMPMIRKMNTLQFAAPELLIDEDGIPPSKTCASDVYAFGMLVLEALSEELPWPYQSNFSLMNKVCSGEHPARPVIDGAFVSISNSWWNECLCCWRFKPSDRPLITDVLRELRTANPIPRREFHFQEAIITITRAPYGITVVGGSAERSLVLSNIVCGHTRHLPRAAIDYYRGFDLSVSFSPNGQHIASASDSTVKVWDAASGAQITSMEHHCWVACIAYSPDSACIASGGIDGALQLWDAETGAASGDRLRGHTLGVTCISFSPDGRCVASGSHDGNVILRNSVTGASSGILISGDNDHDDHEVFSISFLPGGTELVSSHHHTVVIWDLRTEQPTHIFELDPGTTLCVALSPSRKCIASGSPDGDISIWDIENGKQIGAPLVGHTELLRSLAFSQDGRTLVSASWGQEIRVWELFA